MDRNPSTLREIQLVSSRPLAQLIQQEIERQIVSGALQPGERLNELDIARGLGVSRAPVREGLRTLEEAGLVVIRKNYGVYVRTVSIDEVREIYHLRSYIDAGVARDLALRATADGLVELRQRVARMEGALAAGNATAYHELNVAFHERMVEMTGNRKSLETYRWLLNQLVLYRRHSLGQPNAMQTSAAQHRGILAAIEAGDGDAAGRLMQEHITTSNERLQRAHESAAGEADVSRLRRGSR